MNQEHYIWVEKYRPVSLQTYIGNDHVKERIAGFIKSGDIPHLLFTGKAGTGKTTLAKIISSSIDCDVMYINASDENNIDTVRTKIKSFASSMGFKPLKIIILDEADFLTAQAQAALRNIMETFSKSTRFILTGNYAERMIEPIVSRTQHFEIAPPSKVDVARHVWDILQQEGVTAEKSDFKLVVDAHYPDIRKVINECQSASIDGKFSLNKQELISSSYKLQIIDVLVSKSDNKSKFQSIRQILADARIRDFADTYRLLFEKVDLYAPNNVSGTILAIAEGQFKDTNVPDKEINMMATIISILHGLK